MNPDERALLTRFLDELSAARSSPKDSEADAMIARTLSANPDAAYLLVQHAIVADQSLHAAQQHIADLERQPPASTASATSFLPQTASSPWGSRPQASYAPAPVDERPGIFSSGGGVGSFLRSAGTTAAGVVGGEMLFSGLSDIVRASWRRRALRGRPRIHGAAGKRDRQQLWRRRPWRQ